MVGAQKAKNIASNLLPVRNRYSEAIMMDTTTKSMMIFIMPIRSIKFLNIVVMEILIKGIN